MRKKASPKPVVKEDKKTFGRMLILVVLLTLATLVQSFYIHGLKKDLNVIANEHTQLVQSIENRDVEIAKAIKVVETKTDTKEEFLMKIAKAHDDVLQILADDYDKRHRSF